MTTPPLAPEWIFPEYEFIRVLGRGTSGWVALARHRPLDRLVAVKTIFGGQDNADASARLRREGRALALLKRPTIVGVHDVIGHGRHVSLVMQYVPGGDLGRVLDAGSVAQLVAVGYLADVADALTAAAAAGVVHRDVKPGNVLIDANGRALLGDFGLARFPGAAGQFRTILGTVTGTPLYMAPELSDGFASATPAGDAYAFAVLAYRALTGVQPLRAATLSEIRHAHRTTQPAPPWDVLPGFPRQAGRAIMAGLVKDPARRISPAELVAELSGVPVGRWSAPEGRLPPDEPSSRPLSGDPTSVGRTGRSGAETGLDDTSSDRVITLAVETGSSAATPQPTAATAELCVRPGAVPAATERWVQPPVYQPPRGLHRRRAALGYAALAGLILGIVVFLLLRS